MGPCIFCFRTIPEVEFSKEHVIPDSLGGQLILRDWVCSDCNSRFGAEFDHEILKNPEIVSALEKCGLRYDTAQLINKNYKILGFADGIEVKGIATKNGFEFPPQKLSDESIILPDKQYKEPLRKMINRDQRLYDAGLTKEEIENLTEQLIEGYEAAAVGEEISASMLGITLVKRSDAFKIKFEAKSSGDVSRLVAKIGYEFGFLTCYREFLGSECVAKPLRSFIVNGEKQPEFHVVRIYADFSDCKPVHFIRFQASDHETTFVVGFFGGIRYELIAPAFEYNVLDKVAKQFDCPNIVGIEYQQDLKKDIVGFWALLADKSIRYLGP